MNRKYTNIIRHIMDEYIPPAIRDSKWFMRPFYWFWYKGKNLETYMDFKSNVLKMSEHEFNEIYRNITIRASDRPTDSTEQSLDYTISKFDNTAKNLLDVACGRGYFLKKIKNLNLELTGCDLMDNVDVGSAKYVKASVLKLPFTDNEFDIVTCHHTIEHIVELEKSISELKRVCNKQLIIITPKQRYYYYTLDLHVNFFTHKSILERAINETQNYECIEMMGDWIYILNKK